MLAIVIYMLVPLLCILGTRRSVTTNNVLTKDDTLIMRGIGMLFIVFTHMVKENICPSTFFFYVSGGVGVAVCFLVSGYGLHVSYIKKDNYLHHFWMSKILRLVLPFVAAYILYFCLTLFEGKSLTLRDNVRNILTVTIPGVTFWYLKIQFVLYGIFYVAYRFFKSIKQKIIGVITFTVIYILLAKFCGLELFWYNSCLFFSLGLVLAEYQVEILTLLRKKSVAMINVAIFITLYLILYFWGRLGIDWLFDTVYMLIFCSLTIWFVQNQKGSVVLKILGYYSIEIYLIHTVIGGYFDATQPLAYILLPAVSVIIGVPIHKMSTGIIDWWLRKETR